MMTKATWNGVVLAESEETIVVEGNHYFPNASSSGTIFRRVAATPPAPGRASPAITAL